MSPVNIAPRNLPPLTAANLIEAAKLDPPSDPAQVQIERDFGKYPHLIELGRMASLKVPLDILKMHLESYQDVIFSELAAKYLPKLLETYRKREYPFNTATTLMNTVSHTPYFIRFCQQSEGMQLARLHAHRLATENIHAELMDEDHVGETCQFLSTLLVTIGSSTVDPKDKELLLPKLRDWRKNYRSNFAQQTIGRCIDQLSRQGTDGLLMIDMERAMKLTLEKGVESCMIGHCNISSSSAGVGLMQCSRCKCVRYCSVEHQREDWREHKNLCFPPTF